MQNAKNSRMDSPRPDFLRFAFVILHFAFPLTLEAMKYGFVLPLGDARTAANLAREAEQCGWDGFFVWEPVWGIDAWVSLTAAAMQTSRIKLGTMLSPFSRMRPWDVAGKAATLHNLSEGRLILSTGLGAPETGWQAFGEITDRKTRAELLDESLEIMRGLWRGQPYAFAGKHYTIRPCDFLPPPAPLGGKVPIWCVGAWPHKKSMRRAVLCDGLLPSVIADKGPAQASPADVREIKKFVDESVGGREFDIVVEGVTGQDPSADADKVREWREAGATWFIEAMWNAMGENDKALARIRQGPPIA
jgi:alkanesulfonate monooxygenase SsuD/methylene tetrahydromethanopterin reductase-like flavin-dependent oxidoreductase (luciferase family)